MRDLFSAFPLALLLAAAPVPCRALAPSHAAVLALAQQEQQPLLDTLRDLVQVDSGSKDPKGLARMAALVASQLQQRGAAVEIL